MTDIQWSIFCRIKKEFKNFCEAGHSFNNNLQLTQLQQSIAREHKIPPYPVETNVVYNTDFEKVTPQHKIKIILIGDNPGKNEQRAENRRYLVGQAGKLAEKFFREHPELEIDFRENVLILNKSPLHTARTVLLKKLVRSFSEKTGSNELERFFVASQCFMANTALQLQQNFNAKLYIVGYSELGPKKIFASYWKTLKSLYEKSDYSEVFCFQHFSMNRFIIDLKQNYQTQYSLQENLQLLGTKYRKKIFCCQGE